VERWWGWVSQESGAGERDVKANGCAVSVKLSGSNDGPFFATASVEVVMCGRLLLFARCS